MPDTIPLCLDMRITRIQTLSEVLVVIIKTSSLVFKIILLSLFFCPTSVLLSQHNIKGIYLEIEAIEEAESSEIEINRLFHLSKELIDSAEYDQLIRVYKLALDKARSIEYDNGESQALISLANEYSMIGSYPEASSYSDSALMKRSISDSMRKVAYYIRGVASSVTGEFNQAIGSLEKGIEIPIQLADEMELYDYLSYCYSGVGNYEKAINTCFLALSMLDEQLPSEYRHFSQFHHNLGLIYLQNKEYKESIKNYKKALAFSLQYEDKGQPDESIQNVKGFARSKRIPILLETGNVYKNLYLSDSAISFYSKAKNLALQAGSRNKEIRLAAIGIAMANIYNELGQYEKSLEELSHLDQYFISGKLQNYGEHVSFLIARGIAYEGLGQYNNSLKILTRAASKAEELGLEDVSTTTDLYRALAKTYEAVNDFEKSLFYFKAVKVHQDSLFNKDKAKIVKELETKYQTLEKEKQLIESSAKQERLTNQLILVVTGSVFLLILSFSFFQASRRKQRANHLLKQKNQELESSQQEVKRLMQREKKFLESELENKERELAALALSANEMDQFLTSLKKDIEELDASSTRHISKQIDNQLSAENSWERFLTHFENVHPDFFSRLKSDFPKLTNHDLKLAAYVRIGMDNKEIASMTGIDHSSARNSVYRLKKKLDLSTDQSIRDFIIVY